MEDAENWAVTTGGADKLYCNNGYIVKVILLSCWIVEFDRDTDIVLIAGEYCGV